MIIKRFDLTKATIQEVEEFCKNVEVTDTVWSENSLVILYW